MAIKISATGQLLSPNFSENFKEQVRKGLTELAGEAKNEIVKRTLASKNIDDQQFEKYSKGWKEVRDKAGLQLHPPNLSFTNQMLKGIEIAPQVKESAGKFSIEIGFNALAQKKAELVQKIKNYQFFGFGTRLKSYIDRRVKQIIDLKEANK